MLPSARSLVATGRLIGNEPKVVNNVGNLLVFTGIWAEIELHPKFVRSALKLAQRRVGSNP